MRDLVIAEILQLLGQPVQHLRTTRWLPVASLMCTLTGGDPASKRFKKSLDTMVITSTDLGQLSDENLIVMLHTTTRCFYRQM